MLRLEIRNAQKFDIVSGVYKRIMQFQISKPTCSIFQIQRSGLQVPQNQPQELIDPYPCDSIRQQIVCLLPTIPLSVIFVEMMDLLLLYVGSLPLVEASISTLPELHDRSARCARCK